jgi:acetolactate synthase I/II/III large subunit
MTGAEIIVQVLADEGVDTIFGYSGGAILPTYDAVFRYNATHQGADGKEPMPLIVPANEQGAGFMAAGYARASGRSAWRWSPRARARPTRSRRCATAWPTPRRSW